ncbi:MAG: putative rane protein [Actinomycetia bacterium]|nr:putative rane protein [Actinomycetes bacterium]
MLAVSSSLTVWYIARSTGIIAWLLLVLSIASGLLLATRALGRRMPPWYLLGLHRWLSGLAVTFTAIHVVAILADTFVGFSLVDVLVPFASSWHPITLAGGVIAMYLMIAVQITSFARRRLPAQVWRQIHLVSYATFAFASLHFIADGTDAMRFVAAPVAVLLGAASIGVGVCAWLARVEKPPSRAASLAGVQATRDARSATTAPR